jgi:hypothetical protein
LHGFAPWPDAYRQAKALLAKRARRNPVTPDRDRYRLRSRIERLFNKLMNGRRIATRND